MISSFVAFIVGLFTFGSPVFGAQPALTIPQGGTGTSTVPANYVLIGSSATRLTAVATSSLGIGNDGTFSTTSALAHLDTLTKGYFFSTTSADYWETQQTARTADDLTNNSIEDLNDVAAITENYGDLLGWNGTAWADFATSSLDLTATGLGAADFGDFTCNGTTCTLDSSYESPLTFTYPLSRSVNTVSLAFGTTTANTWSALNSYSNATSSLFSATTAWITNLFIGVDTIAEYIADTAGAMFTGNTETDITITYDDADNTIDAVVDTLPNLTGTLDVDSGGTGVATLTGVALGNGTSAFTAGSAQTCTNQFFRSLSAAYVVTCATVQSEDVNLADTFAWTALHTFTNATTTALTVSSNLHIPNAANPTMAGAGNFAINTTQASTSLRFHDGTAERSLYAENIRSFVYATTSPTGSTTIKVAAKPRSWTLTQVGCVATGGTAIVQIGDGSASTTAVSAANSATATTFTTISANNTFIQGEVFYIAIGTFSASTMTQVSCSYGETSAD